MPTMVDPVTQKKRYLMNGEWVDERNFWEAFMLCEAIEDAFHSNKSRWCFQSEFPIDGGIPEALRRDRKLSRADAIAINMHRSEMYERVGYEIKTSRADFMGELRNPHKKRALQHFVNRFYFVTPVGLVRPGDIPQGCGLIETVWLSDDRYLHWHSSLAKSPYHGCRITVPAVWVDSQPPTWEFLCSILRRAV